MRKLTAPVIPIVGFVILAGVLTAQDSKAQDSGVTRPTQVTQGISKTGLGGIEYPCNGKIKRLPADLTGKEYRGQCIEGIEVWSWADVAPAAFGPASISIFVLVLNRRNEIASVERQDFVIISLDRKHPHDASKAKGLFSIDPDKITSRMARLAAPTYSQPYPQQSHSQIYNSNGKYLGEIVSSDPMWPLAEALREQQERLANERNGQIVSTITSWIVKTAYSGGAISSGGTLSGFLYFGKIKGEYPMLMYTNKSWKDDVIEIPLGSWPNEMSQQELGKMGLALQ
jgi:hypothetical protein